MGGMNPERKAKNMSDQRDGTGQDLVPAPRYIETASATTSPDNADSGNMAYLITIVALVVLLALGIALSNGLATIIGARLMSGYGTEGYGYGQDDGISLEDLEELLEGYSDGTGDTTSDDEELTQSEVLDLSLSLYDTTVDAEVSATAYAGVPSDVRTYVRSLLRADRDAASEVADLLNAAARDEDDDAASDLEAALEAAAEGKAAVEDVEDVSYGDEVDDALEEARQAMLDRWDAITAELELIATADGTISYDDLSDADDTVLDTTSKAADAVTDALEIAASR